jgi:putative ABC transport system permease protein
VFIQTLFKNSDVKDVTISCRVPGQIPWQWTVGIGDQVKSVDVNSIDPDFFPIMGIKMLEGRNFSRDLETDRRNKFILNEEAVKWFGLTSPVGTEVLKSMNGRGQIIGVVENFHFNSLHKKIEPMMFYWDERVAGVVTLKISSGNIGETLDFVKSTWEDFSPAFPFEYHFLDEVYDRQYKSDERLIQIFGYFSILAILIASLGLFGLTAFTAHQKTKEIGIRKVLGASVSSVALLLSKELLKWVVVANIIAWPAAYLLMNEWQQNFAYRTSLSLWVFVLASAIGLFVALLAVSSQTLKAAYKNPVDTLRYE